jgi:hypothetical protein
MTPMSSMGDDGSTILSVLARLLFFLLDAWSVAAGKGPNFRCEWGCCEEMVCNSAGTYFATISRERGSTAIGKVGRAAK